MKYIGILSVLLVILISLMISCNGKSQEKSVHNEVFVPPKSKDSLVVQPQIQQQCPIKQMKEEVDSINIKLDKIQKVLKKRRKNK